MELTKKIVNGLTGEITYEPYLDEEIAEHTNYVNVVLPALQFQYLRDKRNQLLAETDYLALADATLTDEMRTYRQALRDLPANTVDPTNPVWPTKP